MIKADASTPDELDRSVYAKMADALNLIEEAYEIIEEVRDGMVEKHGTASREYDQWMTIVHHAIARGDKIRPQFRFVEYK